MRSVIFRKVLTKSFAPDWGAKVYADACSIGRIAGRTTLAAIRAVLARPAVA